jgi:hypothetical protein
MTDETSTAARVRWARLRFAIIGPLLSAPAEAGELAARIAELAARPWRHPTTGRDHPLQLQVPGAVVLQRPQRAGSDPGARAQGAQARGHAPQRGGGGGRGDPDPAQAAPALELPADPRRPGGGGARAAGAGRAARLRDGVPLHEAPRAASTAGRGVTWRQRRGSAAFQPRGARLRDHVAARAAVDLRAGSCESLG